MFDFSEDPFYFKDLDSIINLILNLLEDADEADVLTFLSYSTGLKFKRITNVSRLLLSLLLFVPNYMLLNKHKHLPATDLPFLDISESEASRLMNYIQQVYSLIVALQKYCQKKASNQTKNLAQKEQLTLSCTIIFI